MAGTKVDVITLFPEFFNSPLQSSLLGKAIEKNILKVHIYDLRIQGIGKHRKADDRPFGGGPGMVLRVDVLAKALENIKKNSRKKPHVVLPDPGGKKLDQERLISLSKKSHLILVCGHYEGVDERFKKLFVDEEISVGDYVVSSGEVASLVIIEGLARLLPGYLNNQESILEESFSNTEYESKKVKLLEYPVYTKPLIYDGERVPEILLSGDHPKIKKWREIKAYEKTKRLRPDLVE